MANGFEKYPSGGSDKWDEGLAGQLLTVEFFPLDDDEEIPELKQEYILIRRRRK